MHLFWREGVEGLAAVADGARRAVYQPQQGAAEGALAAAALAHEAEGLALADVEAHAVHTLEGLQGAPEEAPLQGVGDREVAHGDEWRVGSGEWRAVWCVSQFFILHS